MEFISLPLDCQIFAISCYPMYRTLCTSYNTYFLHIYYDKYAYLPISKNELELYINRFKITEYIAVCYDCIIKTNIDHQSGIRVQSVKQIGIYPKQFDYMYTNKIKTTQISYDMYNKYENYKHLDDETTTNILLARGSCNVYPNYIQNYIKKYSYFPQDNDLDILLSIVRNQIINNDMDIRIKLSFLYKKIMAQYKDDYNNALDLLTNAKNDIC